MPIFELGYRHWEGALLGPVHRCWTIIRTGISLAWRSKLLKRLLLFGWTPLLYYAPIFFAIGYITDPARDANSRAGWANFARPLMGDALAARIATDPESVRPAAWSMAFHYFFSIPQAIFAMLVVAIVGPPLIAQDVRSKAFLLYFSKPITRWEYLFGKAGTVFFFIFLMTLFPAFVLYLISIAFSPNIGALLQTSGTMIRIVGASVVLAVPCTMIILCFSSFAKESRYPTFAWIALCFLGEFAYAILSQNSSLRDAEWICCLSLRKTVSVLTEAIFNVSGQVKALGSGPQINSALRDLQTPYSPEVCLFWLAGVSLVCLAVLWRRISAPMRI